MKHSQKAINLIERFEGFYPSAYPDPGTGGEPITIGYGTTRYRAAGLRKYDRNKPALGDVLTRAEAESELVAEVERIDGVLREFNLNQSQHDAVVSFCYNCGFPPLQMERLKNGLVHEFAKKMLEYVNKGTPVEAGLTRRRKAEFELFYEQQEEKGDMYYLINKDGLWKMEGEKIIEKIRSFPDDSEIKSGNLIPYNLVVDFERKVTFNSNTARLTRYETTQKMPNAWRNAGLVPLRLQIGSDEFLVASGQGYAQVFRRAEDPRAVPGSMEPIPQGQYGITDIEWAIDKDNYSGTFGAGIGPVWVGLPAKQTMKRSAFGIHLDSNIDRAAGSAGCVVCHSIEQLKALVSSLRRFDPSILEVDWGL